MHSIILDDNVNQELDFEEVLQAISDCKNGKAVRDDGIRMEKYLRQWVGAK